MWCWGSLYLSDIQGLITVFKVIVLPIALDPISLIFDGIKTQRYTECQGHIDGMDRNINKNLEQI